MSDGGLVRVHELAAGDVVEVTLPHVGESGGIEQRTVREKVVAVGSGGVDDRGYVVIELRTRVLSRHRMEWIWRAEPEP